MPSSRFAAEVDRLRVALRRTNKIRRIAALRKHLESFAVAAVAADDSSRYVAANAVAEELTGYAVPELMTLTVMDLTPVSNVVDGERLWNDFISTGEQQGHYDVRRKDGSFVRVQYWAYANVAPGIHLSLLIPEVTAQA